MNRDEVRAGIGKSWDFSVRLELGDSFVTPVPLDVDVEFRDAALDPKISYTRLYEVGLARSHYNILLADLAFLQFSWSSESDVRYAYYPNPFISGNTAALAKLRNWRELEEAEMLTREEVLVLIAGLTSVATIPVIRYENAPSQYRVFRHPCSHFHIGRHSENRWPVARLLTPLAFTMWVMKQYYVDAWRRSEDQSHPFGNPLEEDLIKETQNCRKLGDDLFSPDEARSPHLS